MRENYEIKLEIEEKPVIVDDAVDVSAALDNCFFHSLALYYLVHKIPLPLELFTNYPTDLSVIKKIKTCIPDENSLNLFYDYATLIQKQDDPVSPNFLYEKTIVLGVLLRSWIQNVLLSDQEHKNLRFQNNQAINERGANELGVTFMSLIWGYREACQDFRKKMPTFLMTVEDNAIYEANKTVFKKFSLAALAGDKVFDTAHNYWEQEGYSKYCKYVSGQNKLTYADFCGLIRNKLNIPCILYNHGDGTVIYSNKGQPELPVFELSLRAIAGHYSLLKSGEAEINALLKEYALQNQQYSKYRSKEINKTPGQRKIQKANEISLLMLLSVIIPKAISGQDPLSVLQRQIEKMSKELESFQQKNRNRQIEIVEEEQQNNNNAYVSPINLLRVPVEPQPPNPVIIPDNEELEIEIHEVGAQQRPNNNNAHAPVYHVPFGQSELPNEEALEAEEDNVVAQAASPKTSAQFDRRIKLLLDRINQLGIKADEYAEKKTFAVGKDRLNYIRAEAAVKELHQALSLSLSDFLISDLSKESYDRMVTSFRETIEPQRAVMATHRDNHQLIGNIIAAVLGLGVFYGIALGINYLIYKRITFFQTEGEQLLDEIGEDCQALGKVIPGSP